MAKVTEYPRITKMKDNDILLVDGPDGTRTILQADASKQMGGEVIMVNETAGDSTKVVINTTDEDIELATMADLEPVEEDVDELKTQINQRGIPTGGSTGQSLRKKSGTNYDMEWADVGLPTDEQTADAVSAWLDEHPEATTTVEDGSLTATKFTDELKLNTIKDYVTPEMFGAKGDGETDDIEAIQEAVDSGLPVYFARKTYIVSHPINIDNYSSLYGESAGWNGGGTCIRAASIFLGDYIFIVSHGVHDYCRSVNIKNINLDCNKVSGGIYAEHVYDASVWENISVTRVNKDKYGINIEFHGHVTQTLACINVWVAADVTAGNERDGTIPLINLERLQECTFINIKCLDNGSDAFNIAGCQTLTMIGCCVVHSISNDGDAVCLKSYTKEGYQPYFNQNILIENFLCEGLTGGLEIKGMYQILTGTFSSYEEGQKITQNDSVGIVYAGGTSSRIIVYPVAGSFTAGAVSNGTISAVNERFSYGFAVNNYQAKINNIHSNIKISGIKDSTIYVNKPIGNSYNLDYTLNNNQATKIKLPSDANQTITSDSTTEIESYGFVDVSTNGNYKNVLNAPTTYYEGMKIRVHSNGEEQDCRITLPAASEFGTTLISLSYFTVCVFIYHDGTFHLEYCDGVVAERYLKGGSQQYVIVLHNPPESKYILTASSLNLSAFKSNIHFMNTGADADKTLQLSGVNPGTKYTVSSVNGYSITVNLGGSTTLIDGTTKSVTVTAGETKHFEVVSNNIMYAY